MRLTTTLDGTGHNYTCHVRADRGGYTWEVVHPDFGVFANGWSHWRWRAKSKADMAARHHHYRLLSDENKRRREAEQISEEWTPFL